MTTIAEAKASLKAVLDPVLPTYTYISARPTPPCITISSGSPYIESDIAFGSFKANFSLEVSVQTGANDVTTEKLDSYIEDVLVALVNAGYSVGTVSTLYALEANSTQYLSVSITCSTVVKL